MKSQNNRSHLRVAVVGVGSMGFNHARVYSEMSEVKLVGVADSDAERREKTGARFRVPTFADHHKLLANARPDIVSVAVPTSMHYDVVAGLLAGGVHVLVEKPLAQTTEEGRKLITLARKNNVRLGVGHIERFNPAVSALKKRIDSGELGCVFQVSARRLGPLPARIGDVGVLLDMATHDIDLLNYIANSEMTDHSVVAAQCLHPAHEDIAAALFRYKNGVIGMIMENWLSPTKVRELSVTGERGMYVADLLTQDLCLYINDSADKNTGDDNVPGISIGNMIRYNITREEPLRLELQAFANAIINNEPFLVEAEDGLKTLEIALRLRDDAQKM